MKLSTSDTLSLALPAVRKQLRRGLLPAVEPVALSPGDVKLWPGLFQHRGRRDHHGERHVRQMAAFIERKTGEPLAPITVWWDGKAWACIDGHHRLDAYSMGGWKGEVPVEVFKGSVGEAMSRAADANSKDKLPMSPAEKSNAAWRLVSSEAGLTYREVAATAGVSMRTVATMHEVLKTLLVKNFKVAPDGRDDLGADYLSAACVDMSWRDAKGYAEGIYRDDIDWQSKMEADAKVMALAFRKALGSTLSQRPEVLAMALELYDKRIPVDLYHWWKLHDDQDVDAVDADDDESADF